MKCFYKHVNETFDTSLLKWYMWFYETGWNVLKWDKPTKSTKKKKKNVKNHKIYNFLCSLLKCTI